MGMRVLLTGATGYLGHYLQAALARRDGIEVVTAGRRGCDLALDLGESAGFVAAVGGQGFDLVVHTAAMSAMGACQQQPTVALEVNGKAPQRLATAAGCRFVQISTDLVFDGEHAPYGSTSPTRPLSVYGMSKAVAESFPGDDWLVLRLPLLFGKSFDGRRGATDMLRNAVGQKEKLTLFSNELRTPLHAADAAEGVLALALEPEVRGIRHVAGAESVSRWEFAERFCGVCGLDLDHFARGVSEDPRRPKDVSLVADWSPARDLEAAFADC